MENIVIKGARQHNLKNISVSIPKNKLVVFTGLSGSGKSSLAFDTIYAEGQRRYVESLSSYARQFLGVMNKPDIDSIDGLSPAISIDQKSVSHNPRSTVGTITEIYDYLRLLFARIGHPHCHNCGQEISHLTTNEIINSTLELIRKKVKTKTSKLVRLMIMSPIVKERKGEYKELFLNLKKKGYSFVRIDHQVYSLDNDLFLIKTNKHSIEAIIDRVTISLEKLKDKTKEQELKKQLADSIETALKLADGEVIISFVNDASFSFPEKPTKMTDVLFSEKFACPKCLISFSEIQPRNFSFNSPFGACPVCSGIGTLLKIDPDLVIKPLISIAEGGILPFINITDAQTWYSRIFLTMAKASQIDFKIPLKNLSSDKLKLILYGTGEKVYEVSGENRYGKTVEIYEPFRGIINELERRCQETDSEYIRQEIERFMRREVCPACQGKRLKKEVLAVTISEKNISEVVGFSVKSFFGWANDLSTNLLNREIEIARPVLKEILARLQFLIDVGLSYLTMDRGAGSLSSGESQRIRLASQIGSGLSGVLYVLDEPSIGLHQRDNRRLIKSLKKLRDLGNTVIVVEHDQEMMENADYLLDFGPGAGENGGKITAFGKVMEIKNNSQSLTGQYLSGKKKIEIYSRSQGRDLNSARYLTITGCREHNLKNIKVSFPLGKFICVTGVSGSGKSTLINDILYHALMRHFNPFHKEKPGLFSKIQGLENLDKVILIDQSPIGRTPRSNAVTYTGAFSYIRQLFAQTKEARARGYKTGRFSFNVKGGRCETCEGQGQIKIEMQFMPDVYITCDSCHGKRYNQQALEIEYKNKNIAQVLDMSVSEALNFFGFFPGLANRLKVLEKVGLGYLKIGQPAPTLSGGEAQRVKLASELAKKATGKTLYLLDEPTTGLHFADLEKLLKVLLQLVSFGNTVIIIEHNLDVIKNADYIIDLGPEGGEAGGEVVTQGTPVEISDNKASYTAQFLSGILNKT